MEAHISRAVRGTTSLGRADLAVMLGLGQVGSEQGGIPVSRHSSWSITL